MNTLRALIVEDMRSMRKIIRQGIEKDFPGIEVDEASNGKEAQQKLLKVRYNIILCDLDMPQMNGYELLVWLREQPGLKDTPFVVVTAIREREYVLRVLKAGANSVLFKPFSMDCLIQKIVDVTTQFNQRKHDRFVVEGFMMVMNGSGRARAVIGDLSKGGMLGLFTGKKNVPHILDRVVIDLQPAKGPTIRGLVAYALRIMATEEALADEQVKVAFKFNQLEPAVQQQLEEYLNSLHADMLSKD